MVIHSSYSILISNSMHTDKAARRLAYVHLLVTWAEGEDAIKLLLRLSLRLGFRSTTAELFNCLVKGAGRDSARAFLFNGVGFGVDANWRNTIVS